VTQLCFAGTEFPKHFRDGACFNAAVQQFVQFLGASRYLDDFRSFLVKLGCCGESHRNQLNGFGLQHKTQTFTELKLHIYNGHVLCSPGLAGGCLKGLQRKSRLHALTTTQHVKTLKTKLNMTIHTQIYFLFNRPTFNCHHGLGRVIYTPPKITFRDCWSKTFYRLDAFHHTLALQQCKNTESNKQI